MSILLNFELAETFPHVSEIVENEDSDLRLRFSYEDQVVEENALFMLNNIETSHLKVKANQKNKEIKIPVKLFKGTDQMGSGDLMIPLSLVQAREGNMKKWITLNPPNTKSKKIDPLAVINKIKLNLNVLITYPDGGKAPPTMKNKNGTSSKKNVLNKSTIESMSKLGKNSLVDDFEERVGEEDDLEELSNSIKKSVTTMQRNTINTKTDRNFHKNDINNISMDDINTPFSNKLSPLAIHGSNMDSIDPESLPNLETKLKVMKSGKEKEKQKEKEKPQKVEKQPSLKQTETEKNSRKKKVDFDETLAENTNIGQGSKSQKNNKRDASKPKDKNVKNTAKKEEPKEPPKEVVDPNEYIDNSFDENFVCDYDINKNTDNDDELTKLEDNLNDFQAYYNESLFKALPADEFYLKFELKMLNEKFIEFQDTYYNKMKDLVLSHSRLKSFSLKYYEKFRNMNKKLKEIRDKIQTLDDLSELREFTVRRENNVINNILSTLRHEVHTMKFLLNINYNKSEIDEYTKITKEENIEKKKQLFEIAYKIFSKRKNISKCGVFNEYLLRRILHKNGIELKQEHEMEPDVEEEEKPQNKAEEITIKKNKEQGAKKVDANHNNNEDENNFDDSLNDIPTNENNHKAEFATEDDLTILLKHSLDDFYGNKKIDRIDFKKLSDGSYKFGTQKVTITIEDDTILVKSGDNIMKLETFLDFYSMLEGKKVKKIEEETKKKGPAVAKKGPAKNEKSAKAPAVTKKNSAPIKNAKKK